MWDGQTTSEHSCGVVLDTLLLLGYPAITVAFQETVGTVLAPGETTANKIFLFFFSIMPLLNRVFPNLHLSVHMFDSGVEVYYHPLCTVLLDLISPSGLSRVFRIQHIHHPFPLYVIRSTLVWKHYRPLMFLLHHRIFQLVLFRIPVSLLDNL